MIVSIPDTIDHQELERSLFLKKTCGEVLNPKLKTIIVRERLQYFLFLDLEQTILFLNEQHSK